MGKRKEFFRIVRKDITHYLLVIVFVFSSLLMAIDSKAGIIVGFLVFILWLAIDFILFGIIASIVRLFIKPKKNKENYY